MWKSIAHPFALVAALMLGLASSYVMPSPPTSLQDCPASPNCVSSQAADPAHGIEAFQYTGSAAEAMRRLRSALLSEKRITLVTETSGYIHAEARSLVFRFVDDIEFLLDPAQSLIQVRSAARTGYSDFGVNRKRLERIRRNFSPQR